jgi:hypothetical protein
MLEEITGLIYSAALRVGRRQIGRDGGVGCSSDTAAGHRDRKNLPYRSSKASLAVIPRFRPTATPGQAGQVSVISEPVRADQG